MGNKKTYYKRSVMYAIVISHPDAYDGRSVVASIHGTNLSMKEDSSSRILPSYFAHESEHHKLYVSYKKICYFPCEDRNAIEVERTTIVHELNTMRGSSKDNIVTAEALDDYIASKDWAKRETERTDFESAHKATLKCSYSDVQQKCACGIWMKGGYIKQHLETDVHNKHMLQAEEYVSRHVM
jgi:hypothetical protein